MDRIIAIPAVAAPESEPTLLPPRGRLVRSLWEKRLLTFLMVVGPGLIVMVADNDAGAVSTYTQAGAKYGLPLIWLLLLLLPCTYFIQEMVVRLGIVTGEGYAAMIFKRFGARWGMFSLVNLLLLNFLILVTEFALISLTLSRLGVSGNLAVGMAAAGLIAMVVTSSYRRWERASIILCAFDLTWIALAHRSGPSLSQAMHESLSTGFLRGGVTPDLVFLVIAIVGTTIAPWQLYFQQSCVADKRLRFSDLNWARLDTFIGALIVIGMACCMLIVGDASRRFGVPFLDPAQMAAGMGAKIGPIARTVLLLLMANAAILGATTISLSSAWAYGEVKGWPHSLQLSIREAPGFYGIYIACAVAAAGLVMIPRAPLQLIILSVQVLSGVMLPSAIIFLQLLLNDRELLGDQYVNRPWNNWVNWFIILILFGLSVILAAQALAPNLFPSS